MQPTPNAPTPAVLHGSQLPLPLDPGASPECPQPSNAEAEISLFPAAVWAGLQPTLRAQIRQTFRRVCEEIVHDGYRR